MPTRSLAEAAAIPLASGTRPPSTVATKRAADVYPLTPMQQGLLYHSLNPESAREYVVQVSCRIARLDQAKWKESWQSAVRKYPVLRTGFAWKDVARPLQVVLQNVPDNWRVIASAATDDAAKSEAVEATIATERDIEFDLSQAPLHRFCLLTFADGSAAFVWTYHHLILDAWSAAIVMDYVAQHYAGTRDETEVAFKPYVTWLIGQDAEAARAFWAAKLSAGVIPSAPPLLRPTHADAVRVPRKAVRQLDTDQTAALQDMTRRERLTLATAVQGAWALTLRALSDSDTATFGWVVADRPTEVEGIARMVGLMINMTPVRVTLDDSVSVQGLLTRLQHEGASAWEHSGLGLTEIQTLAQVLPGQPLFETVVVFENIPPFAHGAGDNLVVMDRRADWRTTYPISLMVAPGPSLKVEIAFNAEQIEGAAVEVMLDQFMVYLRAFAKDPSRSLGAVETAIAVEAAVPEAIAPAQTDATGADDKPAPVRLGAALIKGLSDAGARKMLVLHDGRNVTGAGLARLAGDLARLLEDAGIGPGDVVATHLDRDVAQIVALLGLLSAGCCFLPIDPCLPQDRKDYMIKDSGSRLVLCRAGDDLIRADLPHLVLSAEGVAVKHFPACAPATRVSPDIAYLLYTSGSTGLPKGVLVPEAALHNLLLRMSQRPGLAADDRFLAVTTVSFDIALLELLGPLLAGATLILSANGTTSDPEAFIALIRRSRPTVLQTTPVVWRMLLDTGWRGAPALVAWCGGEPLGRTLADALLARVRAVWNLYGPTEATIWACAEQVTPGNGAVPIGPAIGGMQAIVRDARGRTVPIGGRGELCLAGIGLASGYLGRPTDTAAAFIEAPDTATRIYRTGDVVHRLSGGRLRYLYRKDDQLKIHGVRVELAEIETALARHPAVRSAAARLWPREDQTGGDLVGYVVLERAVGAAEILSSARAFLQAGSVPQQIVVLPHLPVTPSGKIDRPALPRPAKPEMRELRVSGSFVAGTVASIWGAVLNGAKPGANDSFFDLGGNSILVMVVTSRINKAFGTRLPLAALFAAPRLKDYSAVVARAVADARGRPTQPSASIDRNAWQPLSSVQRQIWFVRKMDDQRRAFQLTAALDFSAVPDIDALGKAVGLLQMRHGALRTLFRDCNGSPEQRVMPTPLAKLECIDAGESLIRDLARAPLDLEQGAPLRIVLLRGDQGACQLVLVVHHIVVDEWSLTLLARDLANHYQAALRHDPSAPAEASRDYIDFIADLRDSGDDAPAALAAWVGELMGMRPTTMPYDYPAPGPVGFESGHAQIDIPDNLVRLMAHTAQRLTVTPFMVLLASFYLLLLRYTATEDICIGVMDAGRGLPDSEQVVGPFARPLPLRLLMTETETAQQLITRLQSRMIEVSTRCQVPIDDLTRALKLPRHGGANPLFDILMVMQNTPELSVDFGTLDARIRPVDPGISETALLIEVFASADGLTCRFVYRADAFNPARIDDFARRWEIVLRRIVDDPSLPVSAIDSLDDEESALLSGPFKAGGGVGS